MSGVCCEQPLQNAWDFLKNKKPKMANCRYWPSLERKKTAQFQAAEFLKIKYVMWCIQQLSK